MSKKTLSDGGPRSEPMGGGLVPSAAAIGEPVLTRLDEGTEIATVLEVDAVAEGTLPFIAAIAFLSSWTSVSSCLTRSDIAESWEPELLWPWALATQISSRQKNVRAAGRASCERCDMRYHSTFSAICVLTFPKKEHKMSISVGEE